MCRQPERRLDSARFDQEEFCSVLKGKYYIRHVPLTEYVYSVQRLRVEIPVVAVNWSKGICRCEIWNGARSRVSGSE
jgi:hypothetical protein